MYGPKPKKVVAIDAYTGEEKLYNNVYEVCDSVFLIHDHKTVIYEAIKKGNARYGYYFQYENERHEVVLKKTLDDKFKDIAKRFYDIMQLDLKEKGYVDSFNAMRTRLGVSQHHMEVARKWLVKNGYIIRPRRYLNVLVQKEWK